MMKLNPKMKGCENNNGSYNNSGDQIHKSITHELHLINNDLTYIYIYDSVNINSADGYMVIMDILAATRRLSSLP